MRIKFSQGKGYTDPGMSEGMGLENLIFMYPKEFFKSLMKHSPSSFILENILEAAFENLRPDDLMAALSGILGRDKLIYLLSLLSANDPETIAAAVYDIVSTETLDSAVLSTRSLL